MYVQIGNLADSFSATLKIQRRQKIGLLVVVSLSVLAIIAAKVRVARVTQFNSSSEEACQ